MPVRIVVCPTSREADGLAMSSRNVFLTAADRAAAPIIHTSLRAAQESFAAGNRRVSVIREAVRRVLANESRIREQYISIADAATGSELTEDASLPDRALQAAIGSNASREPVAMLSIAVKVQDTPGLRLIDNCMLPAPTE
jgi:pantothenate synthetase